MFYYDITIIWFLCMPWWFDAFCTYCNQYRTNTVALRRTPPQSCIWFHSATLWMQKQWWLPLEHKCKQAVSTVLSARLWSDPCCPLFVWTTTGTINKKIRKWQGTRWPSQKCTSTRMSKIILTPSYPVAKWGKPYNTPEAWTRLTRPKIQESTLKTRAIKMMQTINLTQSQTWAITEMKII